MMQHLRLCIGILISFGCTEETVTLDAGGQRVDANLVQDTGSRPWIDAGEHRDSGNTGRTDVGTETPMQVCELIYQEGSRHRDIAYASDHERQRLDIIETTAPGPSPTIVWIHGGGWRAGSKSVISFGDFSRRGYVLVALGYRLSDQGWPSPLVDVKAAIRWLRANASTYGIDPDRIAVAGSSAGGHLAAFLGASMGVTELDDPSLGNANSSSAVNLVINYYGPAELALMDDDTQTNNCPSGGLCHLCEDSPETMLAGCSISDCPERWNQASPVTHIDGNEPPFLTIHGTADCTVPTPQSQRLHDALLAFGQDSELILARGAGHNVRQCNRGGVQDQVIAYIERQFRQCLHEAQPVQAPPDGAQLDACLHTHCSELATRCEATPACVVLEHCFQSCFGETPQRNCIRHCLDSSHCDAKDPPCINDNNYRAVVQRLHRPLYDCGRAANCYP